jgi:hypothetical protein
MRKTFLSLATSAALLLFPALSSAASYTFSGTVDDGPLVGQAFSGSFEFDASGVTPVFEGDLPLTSFSMLLFGQSYTLASADAGTVPVAAFYEGSLLGLSYVDVDAPDLLLRPAVSLVPGFIGIGDAYLSYVTAPDINGVSAGFGSYSVAVVPEPAAVLLMLAGLAVVGGMARRARRAAVQPER